MGDKQAIKAAKRGSEAFNRWQIERYQLRVDLSGADLRKCDLRWTNFAGANLEGVDFTDALLTGSYFGPASFETDAPHVSTKQVPVNLRGVSFEGAVLLAATLNYPELEGASFAHAYLGLANFRQVAFKENSFLDAQMVNTAFNGCDLAGAQFLETVEHYGPSHVDVETLFRSRAIPSRFLQQIGVPDTFIQYLPDLVASVEPISFYSCFISHSSADKEFCDLLYSRMAKEGLRVWYAPEDMRAGEQLLPQITRAIKYYDKVVIVLSEHSMQSQWVANEIRWAHRSEANTNVSRLFPISLVSFSQLTSWEFVDADTGLDIAAKLRSYYVPEFSNWRDPPAFERAFQKLLGGMKSKKEE